PTLFRSPGQCLVTTPQCIVQRGGEQRSQEPFRIVDSATTQQLSTVGDQRDQVICPVRERGVVQGTGLFRNLYRLGPHLDGQCRTDVRSRLVIRASSDTHAARPEPVEVLQAS